MSNKSLVVEYNFCSEKIFKNFLVRLLTSPASDAYTFYMTNTTKPANITPDDVELVAVADLTVGDMLFSRDPSAKHPTQIALNRMVDANFYTVIGIDDRTFTHRTYGRVPQRVIAADNGSTWSLCVNRCYNPAQRPARVWRVRRSFLAA